MGTPFHRLRRTLQRWFGGGEDELTRPDLLRRTVSGIRSLQSWGEQGKERYPAAVQVHVSVYEGSREVVREMVEDPQFDREVEDRLLNEMASPQVEDLPLRRYRVVAGERNRVDVEEETAATVCTLVIEGGDRAGERIPLPASQREFRMGRGPWHGRRKTLANDIVVSEHDAYVSRAAALLRRRGSGFEVEARDQRDHLVVRRGDGATIRPANTPRGRVLVTPGDCLEFGDGAEEWIRIDLEARS